MAQSPNGTLVLSTCSYVTTWRPQLNVAVGKMLFLNNFLRRGLLENSGLRWSQYS